MEEQREYLETCDERGASTGTVEERGLVHAKGLLHRTVHVWVYDWSGEILFQKRAAGKDSHPGFWDVSAAGHVSPGESTVMTAVRELEEELGIEAGESDLARAGVRRFTLVSRGGAFIDNEITDLYFLKIGNAADEYPDGSSGGEALPGLTGTGGPSAFSFDRSEVDEVRFIGGAELQRLMKGDDFEKIFVPHGKDYYAWVLDTVEALLNSP